jgi:hypothetical protein
LRWLRRPSTSIQSEGTNYQLSCVTVNLLIR